MPRPRLMAIAPYSGATKSKKALRYAMRMVRLGIIRMDSRGRFWRNSVYSYDRKKIIPIAPRSAESPTKKGYLKLVFNNPKEKGTFSVLSHILAWRLRGNRIPRGMQINHKDLNKKNNSTDNLELVTPSQNILHSYRMGRAKAFSKTDFWRGRRMFRSEDVHRFEEMLASGMTQPQVCRSEGISRTHLQRLIYKRRSLCQEIG